MNDFVDYTDLACYSDREREVIRVVKRDAARQRAWSAFLFCRAAVTDPERFDRKLEERRCAEVDRALSAIWDGTQ